MKKIAIALLLVMMVFMPVFAEGTIEDAKAEAYKAGWDAAKAHRDWSTLTGSTGVTRPNVSGHAVVHAGSPEAAAAGYTVLARGGNAFEAAFATAAAQSFAESMMTNIFGGDAFILIYDAKTGDVKVYNGTGWAQEDATIDYYIDKYGNIPAVGIDAMHVPGEWAGWMTLLRDYGSMSLADIFAPTIELADKGMIAGEWTISALETCKRMGSYGPSNAAAKAVYPDDLKLGDLIQNKDYANLLRTMADVAASGKDYKDGLTKAEDYFYRGPIGEKIVAWNQENGGTFKMSDFSEYYAEVMEPIHTNYRGFEVYACPPNCQGSALIEALNIMETYDLSKYEHNSPEYVNIIVQALNIALNDRNKYVADPRFFKAPEEIWTKEYAQKMKDKYISEDHIMYSLPDDNLWVDYDKLGPDTTFMAVCDAEGNMCVVTHSINAYYGCGLMVDGLGIFMNDRMGYYQLDEDHPNALVAHKRTVQTITPTLATKDGKPAFFVGTPNANNQEQSKLQNIINYVDYGYRPQQNVEQPRVSTGHAPGIGGTGENPGKISLMNGFSSDVYDALTEFGYKVSWTGNLGSIGFGIYENGMWTVGAEPTRDAYSVGL